MTSTRKVPVPVAGSRTWTKAWVGGTPSGWSVRMAPGHLAPRGGIGQTILQTKLGAQQLVHRADDIGDYWTGGIEDAPTHLLLFVIFL